MKRYVIGIDFGTLSGRAILVDSDTGREIASSVLNYPHAVMESTLPDGTPLPPDTALQHPLDYVEVLKTTIPAVLAEGKVDPAEVVAVGIDFTTCTMLPTLEDGTPLCILPEFEHEPQAYVKLWKHHSAVAEAEALNRIAAERGEPWHARYSGAVSCEWAFPKIWEILNRAPHVYDATERFYEAADWVSLVLTGAETHSPSFAGYKWLWNEVDGFPSNDFFRALDPRLSGIIGTKVASSVADPSGIAGTLSARAAQLTGLREGTVVALPRPDAHAALPGLNMTGDGELIVIVGTSGCQILNAIEEKKVSGICGYVKDSIIPGYYTYEGGQAAVGDMFDWFVRNCVPAADVEAAKAEGVSLHAYLRRRAKELRVGESGLLAMDWFNGNRNPLNRPDLSGLIVGLTLQTKPYEIYRALIEASAFGLRAILDQFRQGGLPLRKICAGGGIPRKDDLLMQIYADVLNLPISVTSTDQAGALGSAVAAVVAAGICDSYAQASERLAPTPCALYTPIPENVAAYDRLYALRQRLQDTFGTGEFRDLMPTLRNFR